MKFNFESGRRGLNRHLNVLIGLCLAGALGTTPVLAHPVGDATQATEVKPWDENTWEQVRQKGPRPAAYLFTTSYCSTCVEAFDALHSRAEKALAANRPAPWLAVVMMDVQGVKAQHHAGHFHGMHALYAFDGYEPAVRASVDPSWPDVTPYIVLVDRRGKVQKILGQPRAQNLNDWLR